MTTIEATGLGYERDGDPIFADVDLAAGPGDAVAILGPSGAGKTSLLAMLAGLAQPTAGEILVDGVRPRAGVQPGFALVLQGYGLVSLLTARENIDAALRAAGRGARSVQGIALDALTDLGLEEQADRLVDDLSGGQQQRVAVARALALTPQVLIADEPTAEQDATSRTVVVTKLLDVASRGGILLIATHDTAVAEQCNKVVRLHANTGARK
jgi:putative ABC transport system ATP-binding protein